MKPKLNNPLVQIYKRGKIGFLFGQCKIFTSIINPIEREN